MQIRMLQLSKEKYFIFQLVHLKKVRIFPLKHNVGRFARISSSDASKHTRRRSDFYLILICLLVPKMKNIVTKYVVCYSNN